MPTGLAEAFAQCHQKPMWVPVAACIRRNRASHSAHSLNRGRLGLGSGLDIEPKAVADPVEGLEFVDLGIGESAVFADSHPGCSQSAPAPDLVRCHSDRNMATRRYLLSIVLLP